MSVEELLRGKYAISGTIEEIDGNFAILKLADGQQISWPTHALPRDAEPGQAVKLNLTTKHMEQHTKEEVAKEILKEILGKAH